MTVQTSPRSPHRAKSFARRLRLSLPLLALLVTLLLPACGVFLEIETNPVETPAGENLPAGIEIFFTAPGTPDQPAARAGGLDERLVLAIDAAQQSVDVAAFQFNLVNVAEALIRAQQRGLSVRLVTDSDYLEEQAVFLLNQRGVPVVADERSAFMHNKFVVIDREQVWTGSWNLTENGTYRNNNNLIVLHSRELAANYTAEFEEMFAAGQFGPRSPAVTPYAISRVGGMRVENYFAPEDDVLARLLPFLERARASIYFMAFSFTEDTVRDALIDRQRAGVLVRGVVEARNANGSGSDYPDLVTAGVDVLTDGNPYVMHHKVIIIDEQIVITGSYNFTSSAQKNNDENLLILHSPAVAARYLAEFQRVYQQALDKGE